MDIRVRVCFLLSGAVNVVGQLSYCVYGGVRSFVCGFNALGTTLPARLDKI